MMTILRSTAEAMTQRSSEFTQIVARQMARGAVCASCNTICQPYSAQPGTPCGCKCMMYCAGK